MEPLFAELKNYIGLRGLRLRRMRFVREQFYLAATAQKLFAAAILCYLITLLLDVIIAWALYLLLTPVNRSVSLLTAWFRLVYTAIALFSLLNLTTVYRLLHTPVYATSFGSGPLHAQVLLLLNSYRYDWSFSLILFGVHLGLLGWLIYRSGYIPKIIGFLLVFDEVFWIINPLQPYLYPNAPLGFLFPLSFVELILPLWLVIRGWKIQEPRDRYDVVAKSQTSSISPPSAETATIVSCQGVTVPSPFVVKKNRLSNNAGVVKYFFCTPLHALREERHFALVEGLALPNHRLARNPFQVRSARSDPCVSSIRSIDHDYYFELLFSEEWNAQLITRCSTTHHRDVRAVPRVI